MLASIINAILGVLKEISIPLLAYLKGVQAEREAQLRRTLEREVEKHEIMETNSFKSDADILNELRTQYSRKPKQ
jgi:hypothetical protein